MRIHLETQRLRERLVADINQSGLPAMCVRVIIDDLSKQIHAQESKALQLEAEAEEKELREKEATEDLKQYKKEMKKVATEKRD